MARPVTLLLMGIPVAIAGLVQPLLAQRPNSYDYRQAVSAAAEKLQENPNDADAIREYNSASSMLIVGIMWSDRAAARQRLESVEDFLGGLKPEAEEAKEALWKACVDTGYIKRNLDLMDKSLEEVEQAVRAAAENLQQDPNDTEAMWDYYQGSLRALLTIRHSDAALATQRMESMQRFLEDLKPSEEEAEQVIAEIRSRADDSTGYFGLSEKTLEELLQESKAIPVDPLVLRALNSKIILEIDRLMRRDPAAAKQRMEFVQKALEDLRPQEEVAEQVLAGIRSRAADMEREIELWQLPVEELIEKLDAARADQHVLRVLMDKATAEIRAMARTQPDQAAKKLEQVRDAIGTIVERNRDEESLQRRFRNISSRTFERLEQVIQASRKLGE